MENNDSKNNSNEAKKNDNGKLIVFIVVTVLMALFLILSPKGLGLAGFSESNSRLIKNISLIVYVVLILIAIAVFIFSVRKQKEKKYFDEYAKNKEEIFSRLTDIEIIAAPTQNSPSRTDEFEAGSPEAGSKNNEGRKKIKSIDAFFAETISDNIATLRQYYSLVSSQTSNSFGIALGACIAGFLLIAAPMVIEAAGGDAVNISTLTTFSGILAELVSALFFYLYNRTIKQLKEYHDSLLGVQNVLLSYKLIEEITDENERSDTIAAIIKQILKKED